ncbi:MAG: hypothetical protein FJZ95_08520 [Chloroflexi bacterium]|nr:hypothetical protein [Chloroflexota bacterium]
MNEWLAEAAKLGVGCVFGLAVFIIYRIDRKASEDRLTRLIEADQESRENNTSALRELKDVILLLRNGHGK